MSARTLSSSDLAADSTEITRLPIARPDLRYRLVVMASSTVDLVTSAGGWLFDRAMAGCDVTAVFTEPTDDRALQILGVRTVEFDDAPTSTWCDIESALAVSAELYRADVRVREAVLDLLDGGLTNLVMWGESWPQEFDGLGDRVHHRLSIAARAFKAQALLATAAPEDGVVDLETFRGIDIRSCGAACLLLVAAS
jgi:hypothetical protein